MSPVLTGDIMVLVQQVAAAAYMKKAHRDHRRAFFMSEGHSSSARVLCASVPSGS